MPHSDVTCARCTSKKRSDVSQHDERLLVHLCGHNTSSNEIEFAADPFKSQGEIVIICPSGDLILKVQHVDGRKPSQFRCDGAAVKRASPYFEQLLGADFREGTVVAQRHAELRTSPEEMANVSPNDLPMVTITFAGEISDRQSLKQLMTHFLLILHNYPIPIGKRHLDDTISANLAVLADRFEAVAATRLWTTTHARSLVRSAPLPPGRDEATYRQRLMASIMFNGKLPIFRTYTYHLIVQGSVMWKESRPSTDGGLWWDLPKGIEEEMQFRRNNILRTIGSLQHYIMTRHLSKPRQCKMGYGSSPQCDSFQLGELVRYLDRLGTLHLTSTLLYGEHPKEFQGNLLGLMRDLRGIPSYQIDSYHSHCGAKKLLIAGLDVLQKYFSEEAIGVCQECWEKPGSGRCFWSDTQRCELWTSSLAAPTPMTIDGHDNEPQAGECKRYILHENARYLFTAEQIDWDAIMKDS